MTADPRSSATSSPAWAPRCQAGRRLRRPRRLVAPRRRAAALAGRVRHPGRHPSRDRAGVPARRRAWQQAAVPAGRGGRRRRAPAPVAHRLPDRAARRSRRRGRSDLTIVAALGPLLAAHGIALAGLDVIAGRLIEVNVTCPGGMHKTDALLGTDLSVATMRRLLVTAPATRRSSA